MRQIIIDTETTGLDPKQGHRIIELAALEVANRRATGRSVHFRLDPEREIDAGATEVHGMTWDDLRDKPKFARSPRNSSPSRAAPSGSSTMRRSTSDFSMPSSSARRFPRAPTFIRASSTPSRSRATCSPASATASTRCASVSASPTRTGHCTAHCSTRSCWPTCT
jgi:hypothetical protein